MAVKTQTTWNTWIGPPNTVLGVFGDPRFVTRQGLNNPGHPANAGHPVGAKMWAKLALAYELADLDLAWKQCQEIPRPCEICQATKRPHSTKGHPQFNPIPDQIKANVALDLFHLPPVVHDGTTFETMAFSIDRLSGWMVVVPLLDKGLTSKEVALEMIDR